MKKRLLGVVLVMAVSMSLVGCKSSDYKEAIKLEEQGDYSGALELFNGIPDYKDSSDHITYCSDMDSAITAYEDAKTQLEALNAELQTKIDDATALTTSGTPLDETLITTLETKISEAKAAKADVLDMPETAEEINQAAETMNATDYTTVMGNLDSAYTDLDTSIKQYALVDNPTEAFVIERLGNVEDIVDISAVTEDNDPNGHLGKAGGYTAQIYFSNVNINQGSVSGSTVIEKGTDCGGSIEVYSSVEDATTRETYLAAFDGGIFASGSHTIVGTCLIRTSDKLTASQQKEFEAAIIEALTALE
ncbi:outer membrane protein assembly factor BamD [Pseudobutyrivibrio ruminis]|uniref:Uncharacterized protein n=1 Tax=Pseudobutyrivibrio ruminis DSM 9787 TaxID=1123011 RepID=A0A285T543_9FIRM|nr:hypothetical protein [Pseudobutyrivibrio ruminis]SOC16482.1 hypothetical protein SAMN02910411_0415 [Pseudobutyrivibrio ruminis DSM 9787]